MEEREREREGNCYCDEACVFPGFTEIKEKLEALIRRICCSDADYSFVRQCP